MLSQTVMLPERLLAKVATVLSAFACCVFAVAVVVVVVFFSNNKAVCFDVKVRQPWFVPTSVRGQISRAVEDLKSIN